MNIPLERYIPTPEDKARIKLSKDMLKVSGDGVFFTLQGEGVNIGLPAVFLRLQLCNLACNWCDTKYTWDSTSREFWTENQDWSVDQTTAQITQFNSNRLVVTGGEPLIQQVGIEQVVRNLPDWNTEIETNGTLAPNDYLAENVAFNVSPKLAHSGNNQVRRYKPEVLKAFNQLDKSSFKFVVKDKEDFDEIDRIVDDCDLNPQKMIVMPEGRSQAEVANNGLKVVESVKSRGWRLLPRMHVMLWGDQRGI